MSKLRALIAASGVAGAISLLFASKAALGEGFHRPLLLAIFVAAHALSWAFPILVYRGGETEAFHLDEAFLIAMALILPPEQAVLGISAGVGLALIARRRGLIKAIFNIGQSAAAAGIAVLTMHAIAPVDQGINGSVIGAVVAGAAVFLLVQSVAVSLAVSIASRGRFRDEFRNGFGIWALVWVGNVSAGLLAGLVGSAYPWALAITLVPLAVLRVVFAQHLRAKRDRQRMDGLFHTALKAHASMGVGEVHAAIEESAKQLLRSDSALFSKDSPGKGELGSPVKSADGQDMWLVVSGRRGVEPYDDADRNLLGAIVAIASAALDNAGLHQQTVDERKKLDDVVGSSSDGIFAVDEDGVIDSWNPAMETITGRDASQMLGTAHLGSLRPRDDSGADVLNDGWVSRREIPPPDIQILTPSGDKRWLSCTYAPMRSGGFVVVARDVTAQKEVEELKADFLATVSHELRTPLTPIQGFIQTLINRGDTIDAKQRKEFYATILRQSSRLSRLVEDLLDATNLQGRQQVFRNKAFDWGDTAAEVLQSFTGEHPDRRFSLEIQENLPPISADPDRSVQVLSNLLTNATKYSNLESPIRVTIEQQGDNVMTTVADEGPGVRPEDREKIFERFIRLGDHLTREAQGVGLGLFITRRLIEGMNGKIWVGDSPEGGAAFTFSLPVQATTEDPTSEALSQLDDARNESER